MLKTIYNILPFKREFFTVLKAVYKPQPYVYKHLHFKKIFTVKVDLNKSFKIHHYGDIIENELFWQGINGGWEKVSLNLWKNLCKHSNCIVDVGANTGLYSLIAKTVNKNAKVHAFEPVERVFKKLEHNNKINQFNINCNQFALSNKNGKAVIYDTPQKEHIYSVTVNKDLSLPGVKTKETEINIKTLNSYIEEKSIGKIDLIKIDVETHEPEVLEGYLKYLPLHQPTILIEILNDDIGRKVESLIKKLRYLYFNIDENSGIKKVDHILKSDYFNYLICTEEVAIELGLL